MGTPPLDILEPHLLEVLYASTLDGELPSGQAFAAFNWSR